MKLSQDTNQRIQTFFLLGLEFYKIMMGTFLYVFVPQKCKNEYGEDDVCSMSQIATRHDIMSIITYVLNTVTFSQVLLFYIIEYKRELWCIKYLDISEDIPNNNLDEEIERYPTYKSKIRKLNRWYMLFSKNAFFWCITNFIFSCIVIIPYSAGLSTITSLIGFIILVLMKMFKSYTNSSQSLMKERVFSAYMLEHKTYNTVDEDYKIPIIENNEIELDADDVSDISSNNMRKRTHSVCDDNDIDIDIDISHNET